MELKTSICQKTKSSTDESNSTRSWSDFKVNLAKKTTALSTLISENKNVSKNSRNFMQIHQQHWGIPLVEDGDVYFVARKPENVIQIDEGTIY